MTAYTTAGGRTRRFETLTLASSAARTTTANGTGVDGECARTALCTLTVTAASGTSPTLDVTVQGDDGSGNWFTLGTFAQATGAVTRRISVPLGCRNVRAGWTIGGSSTPTFTFSVTAEAYY